MNNIGVYSSIKQYISTNASYVSNPKTQSWSIRSYDMTNPTSTGMNA